MKNITKVFLFLTVLPIVSSAQPRFIDTLLMRLETEISDSLRMETYFDLSESYYSHHPDSVDKAIFYVDELYDLAKKKDDKRWQVSHFNMKARILQNNKQFEEAIAEYDQGIELAQIIKDTLRAAQIMDNKAGIYASQRRFDEALPIQLEALEYFEQKKDSLSIGICHFGIGFTYNEKGDYEKAILRFKRSHDYFIKNDGARAEIYGNLAKAYREMNSIDSAFHYFELAAQYSKEYPSVYGKNLYELALLHFGKGNYTISLEYLNQIEDIPSYDVGEMDYKFFQLLLGRTHLKMRNISKASKVWTEIAPFLLNSEVQEYQKQFHEFSAELYEQKGDYRSAIDSYKQYYALKDTLEKVEVETNFQDIEIKYETEKKEQELALLNVQNSLKDTQLKSSRLITIVLTSGLILLLGLLFWLFNLNKKVKKSADEKDTLLREIHHRVKNNLQVISALLTLQSTHLKDAKAKLALQEGQDRVQSMALIHKDLYQHDNLKGVNVREYFEKLTQSLVQSYSLHEKINIKYDIDDIVLDVDTMIPLGLMVNELISNTLKHAFEGRSSGEVRVSLNKKKDHLQLQISDDGIGIKNEEELKSGSFGFSLVQSFARKLDAELSFDHQDGLAITAKIKKFVLTK